MLVNMRNAKQRSRTERVNMNGNFLSLIRFGTVIAIVEQ